MSAARIATLLEEQFPGPVELEPELLAYHWEQSQEVERALDYRLRAASKSDRLCALWEAVTHYLRALQLSRRLKVDELSPDEQNRVRTSGQAPQAGHGEGGTPLQGQRGGEKH